MSDFFLEVVNVKDAFVQGFKSYAFLSDMSDYKRSESVIKGILLPFLYIINTVLFLFISVFYLVERFFAFFFRLFIRVQSLLFKKKMLAYRSFKKFYTIGSVLVFIISLPFILAYYIAIMFKTLGKALMRNMIEKLDFSDQFLKEGKLPLFDDVSKKSDMQFGGMFANAQDAQALGDALQSIMKEVNTETLEDESGSDDIDRQ